VALRPQLSPGVPLSRDGKDGVTARYAACQGSSGVVSAASGTAPTAFFLGVDPALDLVPHRLGLVGIGLSLGHDPLEVELPLDSGGHMCRMRGWKVKNEEDARGKLAQIFAQFSWVRNGETKCITRPSVCPGRAPTGLLYAIVQPRADTTERLPACPR
jgi:hypothetical protein